jgi:type II secretory pathway component PulC
MLKNFSSIVPFIIVTIVVYVVVELLYGVIPDTLLTMEKNTVSAQVTDRVTAKTGAELQKYSDYSIITSRNLFQSSATVDSQEQSGEADPYAGIEATKLELVLMGTITGQDGADRAIIYKKRENKQEIFYKGDAIEGALIKKILRGRIILEYQGNDEILDMSEASSVRQQSNPGAQAGVSPVVQRQKVLTGPSLQVPRRRVISSGTRARRVTPEEAAPAEGGADEGQEEIFEPEELPEEMPENGAPEEVFEQEIEPGAEIENQQP